MTKDEFIATIKMMKFKKETSHRFANESNRIMLYADTAITTINNKSNYHSSYENAIKRILKADKCTK